MAMFPKLKTGVVLQYPAVRRVRFASQVLRFVDGTEQSFRLGAAPLRCWEIRLDLLDEAEMAEVEQFFVTNDGAYGSFAFTDPWDGTEHPDCSIEADRIELRWLGEMRGQTSLVIRENRT